MTAPKEDEDLSKELMLEHDQLRKEILHNDTVSLQILGATVVLSATIMSITFSEAVKSLTMKGLLCFMAEVVISIALWQGIDRARSTYLIASYLRIFTEPKMNYLKWETRLAQFRQRSPSKGYGKFVNYQLWTYTFFISVNFSLGSWYMCQRFSGSPKFGLIIVLLAGGLISTIIFHAILHHRVGRFVLKHKETFDPIWIQIKDEEK